MKVESKTLVYFDLFSLLKGLEEERPGIKDRVWEHMCDDKDHAFKPWNGRISNINLYFYGIGDEYGTDYTKEYTSDVERCKKMHPEAFVDGTKENELRKDLNLIWSIYDKEIDDVESFSVRVRY
jgi:hypothetical protein